MSQVAGPAGYALAVETSRIAVIIPIYGHAVLLCEAVESVLMQRCRPSVEVVIVSDGDPFAETDEIATAYAISYPNVTYLRKQNGGPSSARNYGIEYALRTWPGLAAVFFLDADNRLTSTALDDAWAALADAPEVGWIYSHITSFGISWSANYGAPYSPLLHIVYDNICDTGSLVRREVLESGVRFDEDARSGYEDWDFWLQCLDRGFVGLHAPYGFAYRQRPESRFQEVNRQRGATIEHLRRRHRAIACPRNLLLWEHRGNPRYAYWETASDAGMLFTDPTVRDVRVTEDEFTESFYAALHQPDEYLIPPFFVWGCPSILAELERLHLIHAVFALLEREASNADFAVLTLQISSDEIGVEIQPSPLRGNLQQSAVLWFCAARRVREIVADPKGDWFQSLKTHAPAPTIREIIVRAPFNMLSGHRAVDRLIEVFEHLRASRFREASPLRWTWRPQHFPARENYYLHMCRYLGVSRLLPRLGRARLEITVVLPVASYGGAEKVAYAMARELRRAGAGMHLLVVGAPKMKIIPEYKDVFETICFLADEDYPVWGGPLTVHGQECFPAGAPEVKGADVVGLLCTSDLVVNCHSAPLNSIMGLLKAQKIKTVTYLHVFDATPLHRPVGHPYLALGFEHAYDLMLTCSGQLADDLHALGIPSDKIMPIQNAASFSISQEQRAKQQAVRVRPRGSRSLRAVYIGRLDRQKGIERLIEVARRLRRRKAPVDLRVIGSGLLEAPGQAWSEVFQELEVVVEPPLYASTALAEVYTWADVLILPSRWEGAPLVIPECQQLGCIPIATNVGAVEEMISHNVDGLLVANCDDQDTASAIVGMIEALVADDGRRQALARNALRRAERNNWASNFAPLLRWVDAAFGTERRPPLSPSRERGLQTADEFSPGRPGD